MVYSGGALGAAEQFGYLPEAAPIPFAQEECRPLVMREISQRLVEGLALGVELHVVDVRIHERARLGERHAALEAAEDHPFPVAGSAQGDGAEQDFQGRLAPVVLQAAECLKVGLLQDVPGLVTITDLEAEE